MDRVGIWNDIERRVKFYKGSEVGKATSGRNNVMREQERWGISGG